MNQNSYHYFYLDSWALVVGVNNYAHVPKLEIARVDAESVAEVLTTELGFHSRNVTLVLDEEATRARIMERFPSFESLARDDQLLMFFAGHGETVPGQRGDVGYLVPVDRRLEDKSTLIRWDELTRNSRQVSTC